MYFLRDFHSNTRESATNGNFDDDQNGGEGTRKFAQLLRHCSRALYGGDTSGDVNDSEDDHKEDEGTSKKYGKQTETLDDPKHGSERPIQQRVHRAVAEHVFARLHMAAPPSSLGAHLLAKTLVNRWAHIFSEPADKRKKACLSVIVFFI